MTYAEAYALWREANPRALAVPDYARSNLVDNGWYMHSGGNTPHPLGRVDVKTGSFTPVGT